jgi:hypothetical protein
MPGNIRWRGSDECTMSQLYEGPATSIYEPASCSGHHLLKRWPTKLFCQSGGADKPGGHDLSSDRCSLLPIARDTEGFLEYRASTSRPAHPTSDRPPFFCSELGRCLQARASATGIMGAVHDGYHRSSSVPPGRATCRHPGSQRRHPLPSSGTSGRIVFNLPAEVRPRIRAFEGAGS